MDGQSDGKRTGALLAVAAAAVLLAAAAAAVAQPIADNRLDNEARPPHFVREPPEQMEFSNSTGCQIECKAAGMPDPVITWVTSEGVPVADIHELRHITTDGTLVFPPFKAQDYRQDVHAVSYRCLASNGAGTLASRDTRVKAVTIQPYDIYVYDTYVTRGNDAVIKCHLPNFLINYINVTSWLRDDRYIINNTDFHEENKYVLLPDGELLIRNTEQDDHGSAYKCKTTHRLSKIVKLSTTHGKLFVTEPQSNVPPRIIVSKESVRITEGQSLVLPCVAQGNPVPQVKWIRKIENTQKDLSKFVFSGTLTLDSVHRTDAGHFSCTAKNTYGEEVATTTVVVDIPLHVSVSPYSLTTQVDKPGTFTCEVLGSPVDSIHWLINGRRASADDDVIVSEERLTIPRIRTKHKGVYQCFATNDRQTAHGEAIINLGNILPALLETFPQVTLDEGSPLSLQCRASGTPPPLITWTLDNDDVARGVASSLLLPDGSVISWLNVTSVRNEDGGVYTCRATNKAGSVYYMSRINVHGFLKSRSVSKVSGIAGGKVLFHCPVYGYPLRSFQWMKDDMELPVSHQQIDFENGSFAVVDLRKNIDSGDYQCLVRNDKDETVTGTVHLAVLVPPKIIAFSFQDEQFFKGMRAHIICAVSQGDSPVHFDWTKDGRPIPASLAVITRNIDGHGNALSIDSVTSAHAGNYTCTATNAAAKASHTASLIVYVAPKITPFQFQEESTLEGSFARVTCLVYQGDLPISLHWLKDGEPIAEDSKAAAATVRNIDDYSSILTIERVERSHSGNYTCVARNAAASATHTASLVVHVPSKWKVMPNNRVAVREKSLLVDCQAEGFPQPKIQWKKLIGKYIISDGKVLTNTRDVTIFQNGSLYFHSIKLTDEGLYYCYANNGIGRELSRKIFINVQAPVHFRLPEVTQTATQGTEARLACEAYGDLPIDFVWLRNNHRILPANNVAIAAAAASSSSANGDDVTDENSSSSSNNNNNNNNGNHNNNNNNDNGNNNNSNNNKYVVRTPTVSPPSDSASSFLHIANVTSEDGGKYVCSAHNSYGNSSTALLLIVQEPPAMPNEIIVKNAGNRSVEMGWAKPFDGHSAVTKYILQYKRKQDSWSAKAITITLDSATKSTTIRDLQPATIYEFRVAAENDVGRGNFSEIMTVILGEEAPEGSPLQVEVETVDPQSLRISWKPPRKSLWNGVIKGYYIGYKVHGSNEDYTYKHLEVPEDYTDDIIYQLNDLRMYTQYSVVVQAYNSGGRGPSSQEVVVMTSEDTPSEPPQEVRCSSLSSRSVYVVWKPPPSDAIHGILKGYKVTYKAVGDWQNVKAYNNISTTPKMTLMNLEVVTNYSIQVAAFTKLGEGVKSEPVYCKTYEDVPGPPETIKALPVNEETVLVAWKAPRRSSGAITKYNIYYTPTEDGQEYKDFAEKGLEGVSVVTVETLEKFHEISGLAEDKRYAFWVTALSSIGEGPMSTVVTQSPTRSKVPATSALFDDVIKSQWNKDMILLCKAVGIPTPQVQWFHRGKLIEENDRISTHFDGTLVIKKSVGEDAGNYTCKVSNEYGQDQLQYTVSVIVPPDTPFLDVLSKSLTSIRLRWTPGNDGGSSTLGYNLYYQRQSGKWEKREFSAETETFTLENLSCGATYQIYMEAFNAVGSGKPCDIISVTTYGEAFQVPSKEHLIQEGATFITVHLESWPSGGCPIQHFVAEYKQLTSADWRLISNRIAPTQKKLVIPGLVPATWYVLRLTAYTSGEDLNIAEYVFGTLTLSGATAPPNVHQQSEERVVMFYLDPWIFIPIIGLLILIIITTVIVFVYCKRKGPRREEPRDWTQYGGTLSRTRELGVSVESFVPMPKGGTNGPINDYETLRKNSINPYSTTHLPLYNSEMTLRRGRPSVASDQRIQKQISSSIPNEESGILQEEKPTNNNPFINGDNGLCNGQTTDLGLYGDCYDSKNYGMYPMKTQTTAFCAINDNDGLAMESKA